MNVFDKSCCAFLRFICMETIFICRCRHAYRFVFVCYVAVLELCLLWYVEGLTVEVFTLPIIIQ